MELMFLDPKSPRRDVSLEKGSMAQNLASRREEGKDSNDGLTYGLFI